MTVTVGGAAECGGGGGDSRSAADGQGGGGMERRRVRSLSCCSRRGRWCDGRTAVVETALLTVAIALVMVDAAATG